MATVIDGKAVAAKVRSEIAVKVARIEAETGKKPGLAVVIVGDDSASKVYVRNKAKGCAEVGFYSEVHELPENTTEDELMARLLLRGQLSGRADDNEETIKKRLVVYNEQTSPLKEWYKNDGKHCYINGLGELDRIFADIVAAIDARL